MASANGRGTRTSKKNKAGKAGTAGTDKDALIDKALKARWAAEHARYVEARKNELGGWDERYEALGEILDSDPPLYLAGGYKSARAFLAAEVPDQDERSVRRFIRVARYFDPDDEEQHGISKLDALLDYFEAAGGGVPTVPAKINLARQRLPVARDGKPARLVPFAELTVEDIRAQARAGRSGRKGGKLPPIVTAIRAVALRAGVRGLGVRARKAGIDLLGIPADKLARLCKALAGAKLPEPAGPA